MASQQRILTLHGTTRDHAHTWGTFLVKDGIELRDVSASELDDPSLHDPRNLFRAMHTFATRQGFVGGFPTFQTSGTDYSPKHRVALLSKGVAEAGELAEEELHEPLGHDLCHYYGQFHAAARRMQPYRTTGYPTCHTREEGGRVLHGAVFIRNMVGVHSRVFEREIGRPFASDLVGHIRGAQALAEKQGFAVALTSGWGQDPESEIEHHFQHRMRVSHMVEHEGWRVQQIVPFPPQTDGEGVVHYVATVVLTKEG